MSAPLRHYCRFERCRSRLAAPVENTHRAFCTRGCHLSFYRHRCLVCEKDLPKGPANRKICKSVKCRAAYRRLPHVYHFAENVQRPLETSIKSGPEKRLVAGQASATALRLASLPLDPATAARVARDNAKATENPKALFQGRTPPLNLIGGHRFADAPGLKPDLRQAIVTTERTLAMDRVDDAPPLAGDWSLVPDQGLEIPAFLQRGVA
jgi:hypothetical protein